MNILFIGNYALGPGGEPADETHIVRELELQGHTVYRVPRDEWREYVIEGFPKEKYKVPENITVDIAIICKWHHFYSGLFIESIKDKYKCPVFYWVWDYMEGNSVDDWHMKMAKEADLYLSGEIGLAHYYHNNDIKFYYFQFDSTDEFPRMHSNEKLYDVVFLGSCTNQNGRLDLLKEINKRVKIQIFAPDYEQWRKEGFSAAPPAYGWDFNRIISKSKIVLGTSAGANCFGYWSNRVGKVLGAGGFLLQKFTPGMETVIGPACEYFSTPDEAIEKIHYYLNNEGAREKVISNNILLNPSRWYSSFKVQQLIILLERYLKGDHKEWMLP